MAEKIIYSAGSGLNDPMFGKFEAPIKALITEEANKISETKTILDSLFNVEKSNKYAETIMGQSGFGLFHSSEEGGDPTRQTVQKTFHKTIEHIEFKDEFWITRKMADDSKIGMDTKGAAREFTRAYFETKTALAANALKNGDKASMTFQGATVDLTTGDGLPLFSAAHPYAVLKDLGTQSNYFTGDFASSQEKFEEALANLANQVRNFKDENGRTMNYIADTIILPCNRPALERKAKTACGTEKTTGSANNDINIQYGGWRAIILPDWRTEDDRFMVMSSKANENLYGNMFFNRVNLDIVMDVDKHTRDMFVSGYCRFGVGFSTWKHIALAVDGEASGATAI
jgi:hypothetical protein